MLCKMRKANTIANIIKYNYYSRKWEDIMTEKELTQYTILKRMLEKKQDELEELATREVTVLPSKVKASKKDFPYTQIRTNVMIYDPVEKQQLMNHTHKIREEIKALQYKINAVEEYINSIQDCELRMIFELRCYKNLNWTKVAEEMLCLDSDGEIIGGKHRTVYAKKFRNYIEKCSQNSPCSFKVC